MNRWIGFFLPQVQFWARGGRFEVFLSRCLDQGVPLSGVRPAPGGFTAWLPARYYPGLHRPARRCRTLLRVQKRRGAAFSLRRLKGRWGLAVGPVLFALVLQFSQNFVWDIRYKGVEPAQQARLSALLYSMDIYQGAFLNQQILESIPGRIFLSSPEFGWLALNFEKGCLTVEADQTLPAPVVEDDLSADLVAASDGVVLRMNVQEGLSLKQPGQTVAKGEVLVSAARPDRDGNLYYSHPLGSVTALVTKSYQCEQPIQFEASFPTGRLQRDWSFSFLGRLWENPAGPEGFGEESVQEYRRPLTLFGFALPGMFCRTLHVELASQTIRLTADGAVERARYACRKALYEEFPDAVIRTESEKQEWTDTGVIIRWDVQFEADIARRQSEKESE